MELLRSPLIIITQNAFGFQVLDKAYTFRFPSGSNDCDTTLGQSLERLIKFLCPSRVVKLGRSSFFSCGRKESL